MDKSARYEARDYCSDEFDYRADFTQFLEEARMKANQVTLETAHIEETQRKQLHWEKKNRRSWKNALFSWLKTDRKSKSIKQPANNITVVSETRRGHVSGPVEAAVYGIISKAQRAASGPLIGLFNSTRRPEEHEVPYMCLGQLNNPQKLQSYGPLYLVT